MASVHPSRLGLVPAAASTLSSLPPRPSADTVNAARESANGISASREDELKRKLLARRLQKSAQGVPAASGSSSGDDGYRGKELLLAEDNTRSHRNGTPNDDGEKSGLRIKGRGFQKHGDGPDAPSSSNILRRPRVDIQDREDSTTPRQDGPLSSRSSRDNTPELRCRPRTGSPPQRDHEDNRRRDRSEPADSPPRRGHEREEDNRDQRGFREGRREADERRYDQRPDQRGDPRRFDGHHPSNGSCHASPSYRRYDLPPHIPPPSLHPRPGPPEPPQMLPPIWMNAGMAMPPFPPNRARNDNRNDGRNGPMNLDQ